MNVELARELVRATRRKRDLQAELEAVQQRIDALSEQWVAEAALEGVGSLPIDVDGERATVYVHRQLWARRRSEVEDERFLAALRAHGLGWTIRESANVQTLSAWCRERKAAGEPVDGALAEVMEVSEEVGARVRRA